MEAKLQVMQEVVDMYDFLDIQIIVDNPNFANPFTDVEVFGLFGEEKEPFSFTHGMPGGTLGKAWNRDELIPVDGFCDSSDGSLFRIRFMPRREGRHSYSVTLRHQGEQWTETGRFMARNAGKRGLLRVDPEHPFHFMWEGTGEHYFYNGMTAYHLFGIRNDQEIQRTIERFHTGQVNRLRTALSSSYVQDAMAWFEPIYNSEEFTFHYGPWPAKRPGDPTDPDWNTTRFDLDFWRKVERTIAYARERDIILSIIMYLDAYRPGVDPFGKLLMGGQDEQLYFRYAAARLSAFSNITWDITNEYRLIRPHEWVERMGYFLRFCDPYRHLTTCHGHGTFEFRSSGWADFAIYQSWDEHGGYEYMLSNRNQQIKTGRIIPQVNEEFGYEDHYPTAWGEGKRAPARSADSLRKLAWQIYMAGCYQTAGERANNGIGGWVNGRGDESMILLSGFSNIVTFFKSCEWWKTIPDNSVLKNKDGYCLASPGNLYLIYLPVGIDIILTPEPGLYEAAWFNPRDGKFEDSIPVEADGDDITLICPDGTGDMALRLTKV
jgi:hypothetical protein